MAYFSGIPETVQGSGFRGIDGLLRFVEYYCLSQGTGLPELFIHYLWLGLPVFAD